MTSNPVLSQQALNRATLARQMLLARQAMPAAAALTRLAGMQSQAPDAPYVGLWTRLAGFRPGELAELVSTRQAVRIPLMRTTLHLVTTDDAVALHPLIRPVHTRMFASNAYARNIAGVDQGELRKVGRALLTEKPRTRAELAPLLADRWPGYDPTSLAYGVTYLEPAVQVPPRGLWGQSGPAAWAPAEAWMGRPFDSAPSPDQLVLRYLAAFGPASVADIQAWCGLTKMIEITERLRPRLRAFSSASGAELLDLPDAPRPDPDTPAPPRFLPEYDNLLLSHADRTRVNPEGHQVPLYPGNGGRCGMLLLDGRFRANWRISIGATGSKTQGSQSTGSQSTASQSTGSQSTGSQSTGSKIATSESPTSESPGSESPGSESTGGGRGSQAKNADKNTATLRIQPFAALSAADEAALADEAAALLEFVAPQAARHDIQVLPAQA